jgi:hypothetical protein
MPGQEQAGSERETQASRAALRRRLLLQGAVGVPAALAVMQPVKTLAKAKKYCHYSGWHSFKLKSTTSAKPKENCKAGYKSSHYKYKYSKVPKRSGWGGSSYYLVDCNNHSIKLYKTTTFNDLFGSGYSTQTIWYWLQNGSTTKGAFVTAIFNAHNFGSSGYPFSCATIYQIWKNPTLLGNGVTQDLAAMFFQQLDTV